MTNMMMSSLSPSSSSTVSWGIMMKLEVAAVLWILLLCSWEADTRGEKVGESVGANCDKRCKGLNIVCNSTIKKCQCEPGYPIHVVGSHQAVCLRAVALGEDCLADESCLAKDVNSNCVQGNKLKAICECKPEFHPVYDKSLGMNRCLPETQLLNNDLTTLILIGAGMTLLCLLICLVLQIFARARFGPRGRGHYGNANLAPPPVTLSIEPGEVRTASRNSSQRSSLGSARRQSGSLLAPPKGPGEGSRRASNSSIRSTGSNRSHRSYSLKNPGTNHYHHQSLHHRPSDPESRSQTSQINLSLNPQPTNAPSTAGGAPSAGSTNPSPVSQSNQQASSPRKAKRSSSAGAI